MEPWLIPALLALVAWSLQRVVAKVALATLSTPQFYFLSAVVSFPVYLPVLLLDPPPLSAFPGAIGVAALVALTFGITTEALRRGPVGRVSPITGLSPALTALLAITILGERMGGVRLTGVATATVAVVLLGYQRRSGQAREGWLMLAIASVVLQGLGAFLSKVVVTPSGPSALLVTSASVQVVVGGALVRRSNASYPAFHTPLMRLTIFVLGLAALATIGYLWALSVGPAAVIVPLVATSPALGGLIGSFVLREPRSRLQCAGIALGLLAAILLAMPE